MQYESDERSIERAVEYAHADGNGEMYDHGTARAIAAQYNDGSDTTIYSFVSTGAVVTETAEEFMDAIRRGVDAATLEANASTLEALEWYVRDRVLYNRERISGWSDLWVPQHVVYPHESGRLHDCAACSSHCYCGPDELEGRTEPCVFCGPS